MIKAVIPLPNFHSSSTFSNAIYGRMSRFFTAEEDGFLPFDLDVILGRNIPFVKKLYKYKLILLEPIPELLRDRQADAIRNIMSVSIESEIIIIASEPIDMVNFTFSPSCVIYPVYGKIAGETILFVNNINTLLSQQCSVINDHIVSTADFLNRLNMIAFESDYLSGNSDVISDFSKLNCDVKLTAFVDPEWTCSYKQYIDKYSVHRSQIPKEFYYVAHCNSFSQLTHLIDTAANCTNEIRNSALTCSLEWDELGERLLENNLLLSRSIDSRHIMEFGDTSTMGTFLSYIDGFNDTDFSYEIRADSRDVSDMYATRTVVNGQFHQDRFLLKGWCDLSTATKSALELTEYFGERDLVVRKSCMEDVSVFDKSTNQLLLYVDLVWWTLASGEGLMNENVLNCFGLGGF